MSEHRIDRGQLVAPGPTVSGLATGEVHRVVLCLNRFASLIEFEDVLFRTNSAVVLPSGEEPTPDPATGRIRTLVGCAAAVLRHLEEHPDEKLLVAGHTDTAGTSAVNVELSRYRAACVTAVLAGDSESFAKICATWKRMCVADYQQILKWVAETRGWDCDPGPITNTHNGRTNTALTRFRELYNEVGPGSTWAPKCNRWGEAVDKSTWVAYFNCYEEALAEELGTDQAGVGTLRSNLRFLTASRSVGCGEAHPKEAENVDEYRSQTNRRVEAIFFLPGDEPTLACSADPAGCQAETCELFDTGKFRRRVLPPMLSAKQWSAEWANAQTDAGVGTIRAMRLIAPGLPAGEPVEYAISQVVDGLEVPVETLVTASAGDSAEASFQKWYDSHRQDRVTRRVQLKQGDAFPLVTFKFVARSGGREQTSALLAYRDLTWLRFVYHEPAATPIADVEFVAYSPWGEIRGRTDSDGSVRLEQLPPGGVRVILHDYAFVTSHA